MHSLYSLYRLWFDNLVVKTECCRSPWNCSQAEMGLEWQVFHKTSLIPKLLLLKPSIHSVFTWLQPCLREFELLEAVLYFLFHFWKVMHSGRNIWKQSATSTQKCRKCCSFDTWPLGAVCPARRNNDHRNTSYWTHKNPTGVNRFKMASTFSWRMSNSQNSLLLHFCFSAS